VPCQFGVVHHDANDNDPWFVYLVAFVDPHGIDFGNTDQVAFVCEREILDDPGPLGSRLVD
jgi:hypothetical protein